MRPKPKFPVHVLWPQSLAYAGRTLYGSQWRKHVAALVKVDQKAINRWMKEGAPGWVCAHLLKVGFKKYDEIAAIELDEPFTQSTNIMNCCDALWSQWGQYRKYRGLGKISPLERPKQVANVRLPSIRR
jgi:hypothetical protein